MEGAIGSEHKIDVSYLSPHVNMAARLEAATRLLANHFNMLVDVTNPKPVEQSIENTPLAQVQLTRVHPEHAPHVDEMLREVAHRLMGWGEPRLVSGAPEAMQARVACAHSLLGWGEPKLVSAASAAVQARVACAHYLDERVQERGHVRELRRALRAHPRGARGAAGRRAALAPGLSAAAALAVRARRATVVGGSARRRRSRRSKQRQRRTRKRKPKPAKTPRQRQRRQPQQPAKKRPWPHQHPQE